WAWDQTEGGISDGWNLKISTDGGSTFTEVTMNVTPTYSLMIAGQPAWGGDHSADGWKNYTADLTPYVGKFVILRFAFRSDPATVSPGVYIAAIVVAEPLQIPLYVSTTSLPDVYEGQSYLVALNKIGGTDPVKWSIVGGMNKDWLNIDTASGTLTGIP